MAPAPGSDRPGSGGNLTGRGAVTGRGLVAGRRGGAAEGWGPVADADAGAAVVVVVVVEGDDEVLDPV